jgi:hypothetical protein
MKNPKCPSGDRLNPPIPAGWLSMTVPAESIRMLNADRFHDGMEITFSDGTSVFYGSEFLYDHREAEGTRDVTDDPET